MGGIIRYGIPEYRLPKKTLAWEIEGILNLGIDHHTNMRLGVDFDLDTLITKGFDAIFLGVGAWNDYNLKIEGEDSEGCFKGIDFLSRVASIEKCLLVAELPLSVEEIQLLIVSELLSAWVPKKYILFIAGLEKRCRQTRLKLLPLSMKG